MRLCFTYGSVRGAARKGGPYRDNLLPPAAPTNLRSVPGASHKRFLTRMART
jgi:hypothetical protein